MRFARALRAFLAPLSPHTQRSYTFALLDLYDWIALRRSGRLVTPDQIDGATVTDYVQHLRTRDVSPVELRLRSDPARRLDAAIYAVVKRSPGIAFDAIYAALPSAEREAVDAEPGGLDKKLASLTEGKILKRKPTLAELRAMDSTLMNNLDLRVDPSVFRYYLPTLSRGVDRAGTVLTRVTSLGAFWAYCVTHSGENTGEEPILRVNHWAQHVKALSQVATDKAAITRQEKTPTLSTFEKLLATTRDPHGQPSDRLDDIRDRALLLLLYHAMPRASEVSTLRRADVSRTAPRKITIVGKRNRVRQFALHPDVLAALDDLDRKMTELAYDDEGKVKNPRMVALLSDEAPLIPAVARWGDASTSERAAREDGITRQAIAMMLRRRAMAAGIQPGTEEWATIHPHGMRARSITTALDEGEAIHRVRAQAGHLSATTTLRYAESIPTEDIMAHRGQTFLAPRAAPQAPVAAPPRPEAPPLPPRLEEDVYEPEEADEEPVPPSEERIVGVGEPGTLPRPLPSWEAIDEAEAAAPPAPAEAAVVLATPELVYDTSHWGEGYARGSRAALRGDEKRRGDEDLLHKVFVGKATRLPWFLGESKRLKPELPVFSPMQLCFGETGDDQSRLQQLLASLWDRWLTDPDRGPTACRALAEWLRYALAIGQQVDDYLPTLTGDCTGANWFPFASEPETPCDLREHKDTMIARWFESRAWTFGLARGEKVGERVTQTPLDDVDPPDWYRESDPVASLPEADREDLFDWLDALSGRLPSGKKPRYARPTDESKTPVLTRGDLWVLLAKLAEYDKTKDDVDEAYRQRRMGDVDNYTKALRLVEDDVQQAFARAYLTPEQAKSAENRGTPVTGKQLANWRAAASLTTEELAKLLDLTAPALRKLYAEGALSEDLAKKVTKLQDSRRVTWFEADVPSLRKWREERVAQQKKPEAAAKPGDKKQARAKRQKRVDAYLGLLAGLFGQSVADDFILRLFARRDESSSIARGSAAYADLFRVDREAGTLKHTSDFKRSFARLTGAHSECIARRIARHLWELRKAGKKRLVEDRPDELNEQINSWAYYLVPCGEALETELRGLLGPQDSFDATVKRDCSPKEGEYTPNYRKSPMAMAYLANAARTVPTPVHLLAWSTAV